jgi:conjugative transfer signal peptidase TraF
VLFAASGAVAMLLWKPIFDPLPVIVWNASRSVSVGFYIIERRTPLEGEIAILKPPAWAANVADQRGYLPKNAWLLKPVVATGGVVCRLGRHVFVDGKLVAAALNHDKFGRALPTWKGCHRLQSDQLFVLSKHRDSFDSRYFGPVSTSLIIGTAKPLIIVGN